MRFASFLGSALVLATLALLIPVAQAGDCRSGSCGFGVTVLTPAAVLTPAPPLLLAEPYPVAVFGPPPAYLGRVSYRQKTVVRGRGPVLFGPASGLFGYRR